MALRKYKPTTAGTRWRIGNAYAEITTNEPEKSLLEPQKNTAGRNSSGRRSMRYMGGGNKTMYRKIDFKRNKKDVPATVKSIEYDPNRTAFIALLNYADGEKTLHHCSARIGSRCYSSHTCDQHFTKLTRRHFQYSVFFFFRVKLCISTCRAS